MDRLILTLKKTLIDQVDIYKELLNLSEKKTDIIINNNIKELDKLTNEEQQIIINLSQCEKNRQTIVEAMAKSSGLKDDFSMTELYEHMADNDKSEIEEIRANLLDVINKLNDRNKLNESLIKDSLEYIDLNLDLLTNDGFESTYNGKDKGQINKEKKSLFDFKA